MPPAPIGEMISYGSNRVPEAKAIFAPKDGLLPRHKLDRPYEDRSCRKPVPPPNIETFVGPARLNPQTSIRKVRNGRFVGNLP
jgi:hypothetical protein